MASSSSDLAHNQEELLKQAYSKLCNEVLQEIKTLDIPEVENIRTDKWAKEYDDARKITTWTYSDPEGKTPERTGSNNKLVVKFFHPNSYDYVKTSDYLDRGDLLFAAVEKRLTNKYFKHENIQNQFKDWLALQRARFHGAINEKANLDLNLLRSDDLSKKLKHFKVKHKQAKEIIRQTLVNLAEGLRRGGGETDLSEIINDIKIAEKEHIADEGRSAIIKIGAVGNEANLMISAQFPQGKRTLPSSMRSGKDQVKLSNHVNDCSGLMNEAGEIKIKVVVNGHSSPPPIDEPNEMTQRQVAYQAVMEKLTEATKNTFWADPGTTATQENPLLLSFSSMMLLTPVTLDKLERSVRQSESENSQLAITHLVLECLRRRREPIELKDQAPGSIYIKPAFTYMNLPVNLSAKSNSMIGGGSVQDYINEKGFYECCLNIEEHLRARSTEAVNFNHLITKPHETDLKKIVNFKRIINDGNTKLDLLYQQLEPLISLKSDSTADDTVKNQADALLKEIHKIETELTKSYKGINDIHKYYFNANKDSLDKLVAGVSKSDDGQETKEAVLLLQRYRKMQDLYYNRKYVKDKNIYLFQILYLLSNEAIGRQVEAFCKSAEDRTGWLRVSVLAFLAFNSIHGRDPDFSNKADRKYYDNFFSAAAHELSASRYNTKANSESEGLNVSGKFTNPYIGMEMGKKMSSLAKGPFDRKKLSKIFPEPSQFFYPVPAGPARASLGQKEKAGANDGESSLLAAISTRNQNLSLNEKFKLEIDDLSAKPKSVSKNHPLNTAQISASLVRHSKSRSLDSHGGSEEQLLEDFSNLLCDDQGEIHKVAAYVPSVVEKLVNNEHEYENPLPDNIALPKLIIGK